MLEDGVGDTQNVGAVSLYSIGVVSLYSIGVVSLYSKRRAFWSGNEVLLNRVFENHTIWDSWAASAVGRSGHTLRWPVLFDFGEAYD